MDLSDLHADKPLPDEDGFGFICVECGKQFDMQTSGGTLPCDHAVCGDCFDFLTVAVNECPLCGVSTFP